MAQDKYYRLGIDIGGTFTDFTLYDKRDNSTIGIKSPTVPAKPEEGIRRGIKILKNEYGLDPARIEYFVHGMTIGLNTLLMRKGSKLALFVTEGFRDILTFQRMRLPIPFDIHSHLPDPLIERNLVYGIPERLSASGEVIKDIDMDALDKAAKEVIEQGVEGIAICFLHSYRNPVHELEVKEYLEKKYPQIKTSCSGVLWPQIREYERACISIINLYIQKNVKTYFEDLKNMLVEEGITIDPFITQSNGGIMDLDSAATAPIKTLFSGPAAGVIGAIRAAGISGERNLLTFDVGGTSTDVSVVIDGKPTFTQNSQFAGIPVNVPTIDIISIGAGGGSIGWIDKSGLLKLGPESAGSDPGPACYGKSNLATMTDAFLLCGYLNPDNFAAGRMSLGKELSEKAIGEIAAKLSQDKRKTADQMIQVAVSNMYVELCNVMEQKGFDPRELTVVAYGGGGPVTANFVAEEIHAKSVLVPRKPGTLCALGALTADFAYDAVAPDEFLTDSATAEVLRTKLNGLKEKAESWLSAQKTTILDDAPVRISYIADARYVGQVYELSLELTEEIINRGCDFLSEAFHKTHELQYGHADRNVPVQITALRCRIEAETPKLPDIIIEEGDEPKNISNRNILIKGAEYNANIFNRADLKAGSIVKGPAIIEQDDTTTLILPGWTGRCDFSGNLIITKDEVKA